MLCGSSAVAELFVFVIYLFHIIMVVLIKVVCLSTAVLINEYECVDHVYPLHIPTNNFALYFSIN